MLHFDKWFFEHNGYAIWVMLIKHDRQRYLCDEVGVRHEELLDNVEDSKNGSQLVPQSQFGRFGSRWTLLAFSTVGLSINTGGAGLSVH